MVSIDDLKNELDLTDEERFNDLMTEMEDNDEAEREENPVEFNPRQIIDDWIEKDGPRIAAGATTGEVTRPRRNVLHTDNDDSAWRDIGFQWWNTYCEGIVKKVAELNKRRVVQGNFPSW